MESPILISLKFLYLSSFNKIYCIEPLNKTFQILKMNTENIDHIECLNFAVGGFGIDTYYARIFNILQQHKHDELSFLCEVPGGNRENLHILEEAYEPWSQVSIDHYWKYKHDTVTIGKVKKRTNEHFFEKHRLHWSHWADGLTYDQLEGHYNKIKLSSLYKELEEIATGKYNGIYINHF